MTFGYKQRECDTCGGRLVYIAEDKEYECTYCGNRYERTESYDGQFSVRHAAQQALSALASRKIDVVEDNLNECLKIDPSYPGTIIARLAHQLIVATEAQAQGDRAKASNAIAQAVGHYKKLPVFSPETCDVEADFYEGIESADIRALLQSVFGTLKDEARLKLIKEGFSAEGIHSENAANDLINRSFAEGDYAQIDAVLKSTAKLDADRLVSLLLEKYPDSEQKLSNLEGVLDRQFDKAKARNLVSAYLTSSSNSVETKAKVIDLFAQKGVCVKGEALGAYLAGGATPDTVSNLIKSLCRQPQIDEDIDYIIGAMFLFAHPDDARQALEDLKRGGSFISFGQDCIMAMLLRTDISVEEKAAFNKVAIDYGMTEKRKQGAFSALLTSNYNPEDKPALLSVLAENISAVNPKTAENYLLSCSVDGDKKPEVVKVLISCVKARESLSYAAKKYVASSSDSLSVHNQIIAILAREGLVDSANNLGGVIASAGSDYALDAAREMKQAGVEMGPTVLSDYLEANLGTPGYSSAMFMEFYSSNSQVTPDLFIRFLFDAPDEEAKSSKVKMLNDCIRGTLDGYRCRVGFAGETFEGSIWHCYLVGNADGERTVNLVSDLLQPYSGKPNAEVLYANSRIKFKRFIQAYRDKIPASSLSKCSSLRLA